MSLFSELLFRQFPNIKYPAVCNADINTLLNSYNYTDKYSVTIQILYNIAYLQYKNTTPKSFNKFLILKSLILNNKHITSNYINYIFFKFSIAQKHYAALRRFSNIIKLKLSKRYEIEHDMCFTLFSNLKQSTLINIFENNILYKFRISDLINIINKSLSHSVDFFAEPQYIKNPYTNIKFSIHNLYNIYYRIKNSNFTIPILFHLFFISNFNIEHFKINNECIIRNHSINLFMKEATINDKHEYILRLLYTHHIFVAFELDIYFPKNRLVEVFNKYLKSYLLHEYSLNPEIRQFHRSLLKNNLQIFSKYNPNFGKRIIPRRQRNINGTFNYNFNDTVLYDPYTSNTNSIPTIIEPLSESFFSSQYFDNDDSSPVDLQAAAA